MDERLNRILIVYGEEADANLRLDPGADAELAMLRNTKAVLDARPRRAPRPETLDAISAAARAAAYPAVAADRTPVGRPSRRFFRSIPYAATLAVVCISIWLVTNRATPPVQDREPRATSGASESEEASAPQGALGPDADEAGAAIPRAESPALSALVGTDLHRSTEETGDVPPDRRAPARAERRVARSGPSEIMAREEARPAYDLITAGALADLPGASDADATFEVSEADLSWDHSDEMVTLFERVERLSRMSPTGDQWRSAPARRALSAPVGLAAPQYTSLQSGY